MPTQDVFMAHPANKEQLHALKAVKAMKIKFEITTAEKPYDQAFVDSILRGDEDFKAGKGKRIIVDELNSLWK